MTPMEGEPEAVSELGRALDELGRIEIHRSSVALGVDPHPGEAPRLTA